MMTIFYCKFMLSRKIAYLNCAYMSPMMKKVEKAGRKGISMKRRPYKVSPEDFFHDGETLRSLFANLIGTNDSKRCVIVPSVSYGLANAAINLPKKKGKIIVADGQFPSNVYAWHKYELEIVMRPTHGTSWTEAIVNAVDKNTVAVCMGHVHWVDGYLFDLQHIREATRNHDAALIIDGTQSIGALPFDVSVFQPDAVVAAGYKWLFGPYALGLAYYGEMFDRGSPIEENWINRRGSENFGGLVDYVNDYQEGALRYEVGEHSNFILVPMLIEALKQVSKWTPQGIQDYTGKLTEETIKRISEKGYVISDAHERANHLFGIRFGNHIDPGKVKKSLLRHKVNVSFRGDAIRVAPHVYNDEKDIGKLERALLEVVS